MSIIRPCSRKSIQYVIATILLLFFCTACSSGGSSSSTSAEEDNFSVSTYTFEEPQVSGTTYYIDPQNGSSDGDGSAAHPWLTLQQVIEDGLIEHYAYSESYNTESELKIINQGAPVKGGDCLILKSGYHGHLDIRTFIFTDWLSIKGESGAEAVLSQINLTGAFRKVYFENITVNKESFNTLGLEAENYYDSDAIDGAAIYCASNSFWGDGSDVKFKNMTIMSAADSSDWDAATWVERADSGVAFRGVQRSEMVDSTILNVATGIALTDDCSDSYITNNTIQGYRVDGARIISNNIYFADNEILDCYKVDDNHDDGIQSYTYVDGTVGIGTIKNVIIRNNMIVGTTNPGHPLAGSPQGIGCFDGFFENWTIENNLIISSTYHGISLYGARNSAILNNTVIDLNTNDAPVPWIMIHDHKDGRTSNNNIIANNIVASSISGSGTNLTTANNYIIGKSNFDQVYELFTAPDTLDFRLQDNALTRAGIIDQGTVYEGFHSSSYDLLGQAREGNPDLGAYELQ